MTLFLTITWIDKSPQLENIAIFYQNNLFHLANCFKDCFTVMRSLSSKEVCWHTSVEQLYFQSLLTADTAQLVGSVHGSFSREETANSAEVKQAFPLDALLHKATVKTTFVSQKSASCSHTYIPKRRHIRALKLPEIW